MVLATLWDDIQLKKRGFELRVTPWRALSCETYLAERLGEHAQVPHEVDGGDVATR